MAGKLFWIALGMFPAFSGGVQAQSDTLRVLFAGDIMQHEAQLVSAQWDSAQYDYSECFRYIAPEVRAADLAIANLETPVGAPPYSGYPRFSAPVAFARAIREAGFDLLVTANNHSLDRYKRGIIRTVEVLDSLGVPHTGVFLDSTQRKERHPLFFHYRDFRFALLNYTYGTNGIPDYPPVEVSRIDTAQIAQDLAVARSGKPDFVIVCVHWGREYEMLPEPSQKDLAQFFFDRGADLVIGSHPHVVQPMHAYRDSMGQIERVVVYSLGNYLSNQRTIDTQGGSTLTVTLVRDHGGKPHVAECTYSLVWMWKPVQEGRQRFYIVPVQAAQRGDFPLSQAERDRLDAFARRARACLDGNNTGIREYRPEDTAGKSDISE